jgi:hypothetical protein
MSYHSEMQIQSFLEISLQFEKSEYGVARPKKYLDYIGIPEF